jgi:hypothetical protein
MAAHKGNLPNLLKRAATMTDSFANLPLEHLKRAIDIHEQIGLLTLELQQLLAVLPKPETNDAKASRNGRKRTLSPAGRERIAMAQRLRWARFNAARGGRPKPATRHSLSPEGRARVSAAVKARWVRFRAARSKAALAAET